MKIFIPALTLILFTACTHGDESDLTFEDVTADKVVILSNDSRSPSMLVFLKSLRQKVIVASLSTMRSSSGCSTLMGREM